MWCHITMKPSVSVNTLASVYLLKANTLHTAGDVANFAALQFVLVLFSLYSFVINIIVAVRGKHRLLLSCVIISYFVLIVCHNHTKWVY